MKKLFIFGSTGDLVRRKIISALQQIKEPVEIIALGRRDFNSKDYQNFVCQPGKCKKSFKKKLNYHKIILNNYNFCESCFDLFDKREINYFYIALPPNLLKKIFIELGELSKKGIKLRILVEKPFGKNLRHAKRLLKILKKYSIYDKTFLSDHYLFKEPFLKIRKKDFKKLEIVSLEKVKLEGRISYYDSVGALKDMVQSHFLNMLFKLEPSLKNIKQVKILKFMKGRYKEYEKELGEKTKTETYVYIEFLADNRKIIFETGKAFNKKISYIKIDNKKINLETKKNPYIAVFENFFSGNKSVFPKIEDSILTWKIIKKIEKKRPKLIIYPSGIDGLRDIIDKKKLS